MNYPIIEFKETFCSWALVCKDCGQALRVGDYCPLTNQMHTAINSRTGSYVPQLTITWKL